MFRSRLKTLLGLLCVVAIISLVIDDYFAIYTFTSDPPGYGCNEKFIYFYMQSADRNRGIGNIVLEILAALGVARTLGRTPMFNVSEPFVANRIMKLPQHFPNILRPFSINYPKTTKYVDYAYPGCCRMSNMTDVIAAYDDKIVSTYIQFNQALSYWKNYQKPEVLHLLAFNETHRMIAQNDMIDPKNVNTTHNICVHVRRGDFVHTKNILETTEKFTVPATKFVINEVRKRINKKLAIIVMGNDPKWEDRVFKKARFGVPVHIMKPNKSWPTHIDWIFSELYCDTVLQTASASTYGWFLAYFSRGQNVFYNKAFSKPGGIETELDVEERFPQEWKRLELIDGWIDMRTFDD